MSPALYTVRMFWNGRLGLAKYGGTTVEIVRWPPMLLPHTRVVELDYTPEVRACTIRESAQGWREMLAHERHAVQQWLERLADTVNQYLDATPMDAAHAARP